MRTPDRDPICDSTGPTRHLIQATVWLPTGQEPTPGPHPCHPEARAVRFVAARPRVQILSSTCQTQSWRGRENTGRNATSASLGHVTETHRRASASPTLPSAAPHPHPPIWSSRPPSLSSCLSLPPSSRVSCSLFPCVLGPQLALPWPLLLSCHRAWAHQAGIR